MKRSELNELADLEARRWEPLRGAGHDAVRFYETILDCGVVMLLPGGMLLEDRTAIVRSMSDQPWSSVRLQDMRTRAMTPDTAAVT